MDSLLYLCEKRVSRLVNMEKHVRIKNQNIIWNVNENITEGYLIKRTVKRDKFFTFNNDQIKKILPNVFSTKLKKILPNVSS